MKKQILYCVFLMGILLSGCLKKTSSTDRLRKGSSEMTKVKKESLFFDSLRMHSPFTDSDFASLRKADSLRWLLVTDLLAYYYSLIWSESSVGGNIPLDSRVVEQRLAASPACWSFPKGVSTEQEYKGLKTQSELLSDFQTDNGKERNSKAGLRRFLDRYLSARCKRKLSEIPKNNSLSRALDAEQALWWNHLKAETAFFEELNSVSYPDRFSELGMKKGEFLDSRWKRREETDCVTYFALTSPSFQPPFTEYVTWAETQQEYGVLQERLSQTATPSLRNALTKESAAWFAFAKARTAVEDLLGGSAKQAYAAETRTLKKYHLDDLKSW